MVSSSLFKTLLVGGGAVVAIGAVPNILVTSLQNSGVQNRTKRGATQSSLTQDGLFGGKLVHQDGRWNFKDVCFYYDGKTEGDNLKIVGYATGSGVNNYCDSLESAVVGRKLPTVRFSVDLSSIKTPKEPAKKVFATLLLGNKNEDTSHAQALGCIEVSWWLNNKTGITGKGPVVGNSFKKDGIKGSDVGCTHDVFKQFKSKNQCGQRGPCIAAWKEVEKNKTTENKKWEDVWVRGSEWKWQEDSGYAKVWADNATKIITN